MKRITFKKVNDRFMPLRPILADTGEELEAFKCEVVNVSNSKGTFPIIRIEAFCSEAFSATIRGREINPVIVEEDA